MSKKIVLYLLIFSLILVAPLIQGHHNQIDNSTDIEFHTSIIQSVIDGNGVSWFMYVGEPIVAYLLAGIVKITGLGVRMGYLWFSFLALIGVAFSLFFVTRKLVGGMASWLSVPVTMFCSVSILAMFTSGIIFNVINMYIILPWTLYFVIKWFMQKRWYYWLISELMLGLFLTFHASGVYLPFVMVLLFIGAIMYRVSKGGYETFKPIIFLCLPLAVIGLAALKLVPIVQFVGALGMSYDFVGVSDFVRLYFGCMTLALVGLMAYGYFVFKGKIKLSTEAKWFLSLLLGFIAVLTIGVSFNILKLAPRMALDLGAVLALITACLLGVVVENRIGWFRDCVLCVTIAGVAITLLSWLRSG